MKSLASMLALGLALAMTGPAFAGDVTKATTETDCDKAGGVWNAQNNECAEESAKMGKEEGTHEGHASTPEDDTQKVEQPPRNNPTTGN